MEKEDIIIKKLDEILEYLHTRKPEVDEKLEMAVKCVCAPKEDEEKCDCGCDHCQNLLMMGENSLETGYFGIKEGPQVGLGWVWDWLRLSPKGDTGTIIVFVVLGGEDMFPVLESVRIGGLFNRVELPAARALALDMLHSFYLRDW